MPVVETISFFILSNSNLKFVIFDSAEPMRTIFMARGPDFPRNKKTDHFENVNVYPLMCRLLQIECHDNDGQREVVERLLNDSNKISHITWILISPVILLLHLFR